MKKIILFFSFQKVFLLNCLGLMIAPFVAISMLMPKIPHMAYFFLLIVFCIKVIVLNEQALKKRFKPLAQKQLLKENGKPASDLLISQRISFHILARNITLGICGVLIMSLGIVFQNF